MKSNQKYKVPKNYSDIDLIGINKNNEGIVAEVKSWATYDIYLREGWGLVDGFSDDRFSEQVKKILGERKTRKLLVVAWVAEKDLENLRAYARDKDVEIETVDKILQWFYRELDANPNNENESLQVIRLFKIYAQEGKPIH